MNYFESKKLREERQPIQQEMKTLAVAVKNENRAFTAEERAKWDKLHAEDSRLVGLIQTAEALEGFTPEDNRGIVTNNVRPYIAARDNPEDRTNALRALLLQGTGKVNRNFIESADRIGFDYRSPIQTFEVKNNKISFGEVRAQTKGTGGEGGYSTEESTLADKMVERLKYYGGMRQYSTVMPVSDGTKINICTNDDTSNVGAIVSENGSVSNTSVAFNQKTMITYKWSSLVQPISLELVQDSKFDLESFMAKLLTTRIGRAQNLKFTRGSGSGEPHGYLTEATAPTAPLASNTIPTYAELLNHMHQLDIEYRNLPSCHWMFSDDFLCKVKQVVDGDNRLIWNTNLAVGSPDTLFGKPITVNNDLDATGVDKKVGIFGAGELYWIAQPMSIEVHVLRELYVASGSVGVIAFARAAGRLTDPNGAVYINTKTS